MSLCLVLLLVAIGINWWNDWEPFAQPSRRRGVD
jgi:hypothetical protein